MSCFRPVRVIARQIPPKSPHPSSSCENVSSGAHYANFHCPERNIRPQKTVVTNMSDAIGLYLNEIGKVALLNEVEKIHSLGEGVATGDGNDQSKV